MIRYNLNLAVLFACIASCMSYPMIFEVDSGGQGCMDLYIPDSDDAHLVFIPLPEEMETHLEDWFISEAAEIARPSSTQFLKDLSKMPNNIAQGIKQYKSRSKVTMSIERDGVPTVFKHMALTYFKPFVVKDLAHTSMGKSRNEREDWDEGSGTYRFCVYVRGSEEVHVLFDVVKISEYQQLMDKKHIVRKEHLSPLELAFEESANLAKTIIDEMHYMEKREARMKQTSDRTNARIKWFSYLSISILLGVTYVQAKYLKSYFKKKKIL